MNTINLGILAHVDAGKTSLTERLLFAAGVIDEIGSVDRGNTQTDSLALERQRGITIKAAVVSFVVGATTINLIDTPGHPDFIAEVERALSVLDGAVLVISAVEGVQAQTRVLMRALQRLRIPTLLFVNKIDRRGAQETPLLASIAEKLSPAIVPMGVTAGLGTRDAGFVPFTGEDAAFRARLVEQLAEHDEALLAAYVDGAAALGSARLHAALAAQTRQGLVHPVYFGSAITGAGVEPLIAGIQELLPAATGSADDPVSGSVFKIERAPAGDKIAYVRLFAGALHARERVAVGQSGSGRVTAIGVFERGTTVQRPVVVAGQIAKVWGLGDVRIGDALGEPPPNGTLRQFPPPTLETVILPRRAADNGVLYGALAQLAEQDPLINVRIDDARHELYVSLYGEVQKEVIQATLATDFGVDVEFQETTTICAERVVGTGTAIEILGKAPNPFMATVGLRVEPGPSNTGVTFRLEVRAETIPLFVFKSRDEFQRAMAETVAGTLRQGLFGWNVIDCVVTMTASGYVSPSSSARDFRLLTPLVLMSALQEAGTQVCEPMHRFRLELPADTFGPLLPALAQLRAIPGSPTIRGTTCTLEGDIPAARVHELQQKLPALTRGEGVLESTFDRYEPLRGTPPTRPRFDNNPLNRKEYLLRLSKRA